MSVRLIRPARLHMILLSVALTAGAGAVLISTPKTAFAQKTDVVTLNNGDDITGEVKELKTGKLKYSTDAMSTIYIEWPKIGALTTEGKIFEVELEDGTSYFGSLRPGEGSDETHILVAGDTIKVATGDVVRLERIKKSVWDQIDGNLDIGFDYTQQNDKIDLNLSSDVKYKWGLNNIRWDLGITLSRQTGADDIDRLNTTVMYIRQFGGKWFWTGLASAETNTQLSLDIRGSAGGGIGRFLIQSNKIVLGLAGGAAYARERFTDQDPDNVLQAFALTDFQYFSWGDLDTDLSSRLMVIPILNQSGRIRLSFTTNFKREFVNNFYFNIGVTESYDSQPPDPEAAQNDLTFTTGIGWSF